ncbi:MAG: hypothetical protein H0U76_15345, partial [Ktedonobacteraceae bacterium]|nr:hypothetical protein [Ktedonobacteraceae bacterium]
MNQFIPPPVYCPFPSEYHPAVDVVERHSQEWVLRFRLVQAGGAFERFRAARFAWLNARAAARAEIADLALLTDWVVWIFLLDDHFDEGVFGRSPARIETWIAQYLAILRGKNTPPITNGPTTNSLREWWSRVGERSTAAWRERFISVAEDYFAGCRWEAQNRATGHFPGLAEYVVMRRQTSALRTVFTLGELTEGVTLPAIVLGHPAIYELADVANDAVAWFNDLVSFQKEIERGDPHNWACVFARETGCSTSAALHCLAEAHNDRVRRYIALEHALPTFDAITDRALRRYLHTFRGWMRGNIDWASDSGRYQNIPPTAAGYLDPIFG